MLVIKYFRHGWSFLICTKMLKLLYINMVGTFLLTDLIKFTKMLKLLFTNMAENF